MEGASLEIQLIWLRTEIADSVKEKQKDKDNKKMFQNKAETENKIVVSIIKKKLIRKYFAYVL
jgi:hypothetical protein